MVSFANADLTCSSSFVMRNDSSVDQIVAKVRVHYISILSSSIMHEHIENIRKYSKN